MKMIRRFLAIFIYLIPQFLIWGMPLVNEDLKKSLESLYNYNPKLKYERNILKAKDELMPQALSEFRPEIKDIIRKEKFTLILMVLILPLMA